ncbi:hypothetical protein PMZ80_008567 [Knufia obscura]|uniref:Acyl-CoA thioesterase-like N-terminal HotDog domain-containing protein n=2 Tax=Knufia TaxID=430999 RepID=A0AAN8ECH6_9EURO|nr:hypothetical protein PMZ80_008567 [Knufia obscura]KAK5952023.1 hypothetical protein OHC33_006909 [Knufia fluminis]
MPPHKPPPKVLPDSDWSKRAKAITFRKLMHLDRHHLMPDIFLSTSAAYPPTPTTRTYGGHVFAQAAWAAAHTVAYGLHVHSITGWFLLLGDTRYAFEYRVRRVRDGGVYALRVVEAYQDSDAADHGKTPTFMAVVSFKRDERGKHKAGAKGQRRDFEHQEVPGDWLEREYGHLLRRKQRFEDWPTAQGMDGMWSSELSVDVWEKRGEGFPGLEMRKVNMDGYNAKACPGAMADNGESARKWRLLMLYRLVTDAEEERRTAEERGKHRKNGADDVINLHACAHLYASDRNSLFLAQRALGFERSFGQVGSLSHTVNFHGYAPDLVMVDEKTGRLKEFVQESWTSNSGADRVTHNSRMWDKEAGRVFATTVQDGMMRIQHGEKKGLIDYEALLRRESKL